jgi:hypothetical protein
MSTVTDRVQRMSVNELWDAVAGKGDATGHDDGLASLADWAEAATQELKRRGYNVPTNPAPKDQSVPSVPSDPISADAHFIAMSASKDAGRIIKHLFGLSSCCYPWYLPFSLRF